MFRTAIPVAVVLSLVRAADAQPSRDQTFDDLGRSLENIQRSLQGTKAPEPAPTGSLMTGVTVVPWKELNVFSSANAAATSGNKNRALHQADDCGRGQQLLPSGSFRP